MDNMEDDDDDESYNDYIDDLLDENESMSFATRVTRWLTALTVCGWPPVKGGADVSLVRVLPSTLGGSGVFARRSIGANVTVGEYPGVRRSLADYLAKCERTGGRTEVYSLMCRDGWVLDPTGASGVLGTGVGVDDDSYGMDDDSYSYGAYGAGTATPTVRLGWFGGVFLGSVSRDATMELCNEPGDVNLDSASRAEAANVGVQELATGTQVVFTLRDIAEGEELLWDYGESYNREHY